MRGVKTSHQKPAEDPKRDELGTPETKSQKSLTSIH